MRIQFWGVRGAIPAPGVEFIRYGGNTACVSIEAGEGVLILDAGTGIIPLGQQLISGSFGSGAGKAALLLTHAHWDHIQGFPFFQPAFIPGNELTILGSCGSSGMLEGILEGQMNPHFNPVQSLRNLGAAISIVDVQPGVAVAFEQFQVRAHPVPHGHITSLAFRVDYQGRSVVYVPDVGYASEHVAEDVLQLYRGADCLIHDCTYTPEDRVGRETRGYCSIDIAARVAAAAQVGRLVMFHYDQDYTDDQVDALSARCRNYLDAETGGREIALTAAQEGLILEL